jgi:nicotinamidase-related amidase
MAAIAPEVAPKDGEAVIIKAMPNSFAGTNLQEVLQAIGRKQLIVAGFMTHMCVSTTVRAAVDFGYMSTIVANACATRDLPDGEGGVVTAAELQRAELAALSDRFAIIVPDVSVWG